MEWGTRHGRMQITIKGTPRAHWYYWIRQEGASDWRAGYYGYGQEIACCGNDTPCSEPYQYQATLLEGHDHEWCILK